MIQTKSMWVIKSVLNDIIPIVVTAVCSYSVWVLQNIRTERKKSEDGIRVLLRMEMKRIWKELHDKPSLTPDELEDINEVYTAYENRGGNGTIKKIYSDLMKKEVDHC